MALNFKWYLQYKNLQNRWKFELSSNHMLMPVVGRHPDSCIVHVQLSLKTDTYPERLQWLFMEQALPFMEQNISCSEMFPKKETFLYVEQNYQSQCAQLLCNSSLHSTHDIPNLVLVVHQSAKRGRFQFRQDLVGADIMDRDRNWGRFEERWGKNWKTWGRSWKIGTEMLSFTPPPTSI